MAVIRNTFCQKYILLVRDIKSMFYFICYYTSFQEMQFFLQ